MGTKFSQIASGGAVAGATDKALVVRSGTTDLLVTPVALDISQTWEGVQTFIDINLVTHQSNGVATIAGIGSGDMSVEWQGVQGGVGDTRTGVQLRAPNAILAAGTGIQEWVAWGKIAFPVISTSGYTRIEYGWGSSAPGLFGMHQEAGIISDVIPAPGGDNCAPQSLSMADHTLGLACLHIMGGTDGFLQSAGYVNSTMTHVINAFFFGLSNFDEVAGVQFYDGVDIAYLRTSPPVADGHHNSHCLVWVGQWYTSGAAHWQDWKWEVVVSNNTGTNSFVLKTRTDNGSFASRLTIPTVVPILATGVAHTVDDVISFLQTLGLCKQA